MDKRIDWFLCGSTTTIRVTTTTTTTIAMLRTREMFGCRLSLYVYPTLQQTTPTRSGLIVTRWTVRNKNQGGRQQQQNDLKQHRMASQRQRRRRPPTALAICCNNLHLQHARTDILAAWTASDALARVQKTRPAMSTRRIGPYLPLDDRVPMIRASVRTTWPLVVDTVDHAQRERST
jgi:hypothetical protein